MRVKVPNIFLFKDIGVLLKGRYVGVLTFRTMLDGKVHFYQKVILQLSVISQGKSPEN